jgi:hypothetical protein
MCQQNGYVVETFFKREYVGRMIPRIHQSEIHQWLEKNCYAFIWKEEELQGKYVKDTIEVIFYSERSSDQYEIFWVKFLEELFHWIERLQEALELQKRVKKTCTWDTKRILALHLLDHSIT